MSKKGGSNKEAKQARKDEQKRQDTIRTGTTNVNNTFDSQFNDQYFNGLRQNYLDYADPQLQQQYGDAKTQLTYSLARSGLLDSSVRAAQEAKLQTAYDTQAKQIADTALSNANTARSNVETSRANLISNLNTTGDATGAANQALAQASILSQPATYSPLTNLFADFTSGLGIQAAQEKAAALSGGQYQSKYSTGLFGTSPAAVKNT